MPQCSATTVSGTQCKKNAMAGTDKCAFHVGPHVGQNLSKLTPELIDNLCRVLRTGNYLTVACRAVGITQQTLHSWLHSDDDRYDDLRARVEQARSEGEVRNVALISQAATDSWQAAAWLLERAYPERWGRTSVRLRDPADDEEAQAAPNTDPFAEVDDLAEARRKRRLAT